MQWVHGYAVLPGMRGSARRPRGSAFPKRTKQTWSEFRFPKQGYAWAARPPEELHSGWREDQDILSDRPKPAWRVGHDPRPKGHLLRSGDKLLVEEPGAAVRHRRNDGAWRLGAAVAQEDVACSPTCLAHPTSVTRHAALHAAEVAVLGRGSVSWRIMTSSPWAPACRKAACKTEVGAIAGIR